MLEKRTKLIYKTIKEYSRLKKKLFNVDFKIEYKKDIRRVTMVSDDELKKNISEESNDNKTILSIESDYNFSDSDQDLDERIDSVSIDALNKLQHYKKIRGLRIKKRHYVF